MWTRVIVMIGICAAGSAAAAPVEPPAHQELAAHRELAPPCVPSFATDRTVGRPCAELPLAVTSFGAAVDGGFLYVLGGYTGKPHDYRAEFQSRAFYRIDVLDPTRVEMLPNDDGVQSVALAAFDGRLVRVGGMTVTDGGPKSIVDCAAFDPTSRHWTPLASLPEPRSSHDAVVIDGVLYVVGGWTLGADPGGGPQTSDWHDRMLTLDLTRPDAAWKELPQPFERRGLAVTACHGKLVVVGGMTADNAPSTMVDLFDPATGAWSSGPAFPGPGFGVAASCVGERVVASGADGAVWEWTLDATRWERAGTLTFPRFFHRLVSVGDGEVWALGGIGAGDVRPRPIESLELDKNACDASAAVVAHWTVPNPVPAKNRQAVFLRGDSLYLFGGNDSLEQHDFGPEHFRSEGVRVDLANLACTRVADFPVRRQTVQTEIDGAATIGFAIGGFGNDGRESSDARTFSDGFAFDFRAGTWSPFAAKLPEPRSQFGLVRNGNDLFVFGGLDFDPTRDGADRFHYPLSVLSCRPGRDDAFRATDVELPVARRSFAGAQFDGRYYLVGGMKGEFQPVESCDVFDFASKTWSAIPSPPRPRIGGQLVALEHRLYLAGGSSRGPSGKVEPDTSLESFDPATNAWSRLLELPIAPSHLRMFEWRGHLLVVSTHDADHEALHVLLIRPGTPAEPTQFVRSAR